MKFAKLEGGILFPLAIFCHLASNSFGIGELKIKPHISINARIFSFLIVVTVGLLKLLFLESHASFIFLSISTHISSILDVGVMDSMPLYMRLSNTDGGA